MLSELSRIHEGEPGEYPAALLAEHGHERQPSPNALWCLGCSPDNCPGCPPIPTNGDTP